MGEKRYLKNKFSSILANSLVLVSEEIQKTKRLIYMCACMFVILSPHPLDILKSFKLKWYVFKTTWEKEFPGGLVKTLTSNAGGAELKKTQTQKQYYNKFNKDFKKSPHKQYYNKFNEDFLNGPHQKKGGEVVQSIQIKQDWQLDDKLLKLSNSKVGFIVLIFLHLFSSVTQSYLTLCNPVDCSTPGFPVHH